MNSVEGDTLSNKLQGESTLIKLVYAHLPALEEYGTTHLRARSRSQTNNTEPRRRVQGIQTPQRTTQNRTSKMTPKRNPNQKWHQNDTKRKSKWFTSKCIECNLCKFLRWRIFWNFIFFSEKSFVIYVMSCQYDRWITSLTLCPMLALITSFYPPRLFYHFIFAKLWNFWSFSQKFFRFPRKPLILRGIKSRGLIWRLLSLRDLMSRAFRIFGLLLKPEINRVNTNS